MGGLKWIYLHRLWAKSHDPRTGLQPRVCTLFGHTKAKRNSHVWLQCASRTVLGLVIGTVLLLTVQLAYYRLEAKEATINHKKYTHNKDHSFLYFSLLCLVRYPAKSPSISHVHRDTCTFTDYRPPHRRPKDRPSKTGRKRQRQMTEEAKLGRTPRNTPRD